MKKVLWVLGFVVFWWAIYGLQKSTENERLGKEAKTQIIIDSLNLHIDSLQNEIYKSIDTIQYESIDTTVIYWPWGREEFYYYKYENTNNDKNLLSAIIYVESSNNDSAYCVSEDAVGCLQIRKCMVNDVNRILRRQKSDLRFSYDDRWLRNKSVKMFDIYCKHYGLTTAEEIARCWNGGPRGSNNPATVGYWEKVKTKINS